MAAAAPGRFVLGRGTSSDVIVENWNGIAFAEPVPIVIAALREGMLRLAGRIGDGAIINWLAPDDVTRMAAIVTGENPDAEIVARIFVAPTSDRDVVMRSGRLLVHGTPAECRARHLNQADVSRADQESAVAAAAFRCPVRSAS